MDLQPFFSGLVVLAFALSASAVEPVTHKDIPAALKESKTLGVPAYVVLTKNKVAAPAAVAEVRVIQASRALVLAEVALTPALAKKYELKGDSNVLLLDLDGNTIDKFGADADPELLLASINKCTDAARAELIKSSRSDAKSRKAAWPGLNRIGPFAADLIPYLGDPDPLIKEAARKAIASLPPDSSMTALLDALKSDEKRIRTAAHPLLAQASKYKVSPLSVWESGTAVERAAAWAKWDKAIQDQLPPLNKGLLAFCEKHLGEQVNNGECAMLVIDAYGVIGAKQKWDSGATYLWGRQLKFGETVLPGDVAQFEKTKFSDGWSYSHHTAVIRKVLEPGKFETLQQNVGGKTVKPGKLDLTARTEGSVVIYRPQPK